MEKVWTVTPGANVSSWDLDTKSDPAVALPDPGAKARVDAVTATVESEGPLKVTVTFTVEACPLPSHIEAELTCRTGASSLEIEPVAEDAGPTA